VRSAPLTPARICNRPTDKAFRGEGEAFIVDMKSICYDIITIADIELRPMTWIHWVDHTPKRLIPAMGRWIEAEMAGHIEDCSGQHRRGECKHDGRPPTATAPQ
jgi:hypothetical protein